MTLLLIALTVYAAASAVLGPRLMRAFRCWQCESPRLGIALWTTLTASWIVSVISIGLAATAQLSGGLGLAGLLHACMRALLTILGLRDPSEAPAAVALIGCLAVVARLTVVAVRQVHRTRRHRRQHWRALRSSGAVRTDAHRVTVVDASEPAAYCVPGHHAGIVLTAGAVQRLSRPELGAIITHEVAHLRGRHHLCVGWVAILVQAFPFVPLLDEALRQVTRLVEWIADDAAGRRHGNRVVARALLVMATGALAHARVPDVVLAAGGSDVPKRVRRLLRPEPMTRSASVRIGLALVMPALVVVAAAAVLVPSITVDPTPLCASPGVIQLSD